MKSISPPCLPSRHACRTLAIIPLLLGLNGCGYLISSATEDFSTRLKQAVMEHDDPETVTGALPAYLLLQEAQILGDADNESLLFSTANLYGAYLGLLPDDPVRKRRLSQKSLDFALRAACVHDDKWCSLQQKSFDDLRPLIEQTDADDTDRLYGIATAWAAWIQANKDNWNAIAQLAQVKLLMQRVLELDDTYKQGNAHVYMGVLESLVPENLGGKPELAQRHFQRASALAPDNLMTRVLYAKHYARMVFDRDLHDTLLKSTLNAKPTAPGLTLINTLAQQQAQQLLDSADDYF
ncbi:TRAP transporter TatT component family protein [Methylomonas rapida]|uniref:TRAP transporter TatT component family protein n=1 Tax=Methylomonas rapida TaxID=2963939 RepID=A0ABY7GLK2_9GAMM|nr:TRAP transporter TatT component family protein [Methylomonas rapida]WAR45383.1 TRAP transporter TatT component family protein [Methylomonas rapida]